MTLRIPVSTQEPIATTQIRSPPIKRTFRRLQQDVNGDFTQRVTCPSGYAWRVFEVYVYAQYGGIDAGQYCELVMASSVGEGAATLHYAYYNAWVSNCACKSVFMIGAGGGSSQSSAAAVVPQRYYCYGLPDILLTENDYVEVRAYNFGATEDILMYVMYEQVQL